MLPDMTSGNQTPAIIALNFEKIPPVLVESIVIKKRIKQNKQASKKIN